MYLQGIEVVSFSYFLKVALGHGEGGRALTPLRIFVDHVTILSKMEPLKKKQVMALELLSTVVT